MTTYWMSFRLADDVAHKPTYEERYDALIKAITEHSDVTKFWARTSSFFVFETEEDIGTLAALYKNVIAPQYDLFIMRVLDQKTAVICGKNDDPDIFALMPYLKKV